jgi:hypothetical protein
VSLVVGEPMEVAKASSDDALEDVRVELERRLAALEQRAREMVREG